MNEPIFVPGDVIATLRNCNGVYECPMDANGHPLGPLVGYAGQYEGTDGNLLNYVGFVYYNVGQGDQFPSIVYGWAYTHAKSLISLVPTLLVAAPMGGITYMEALKSTLWCRGIFAEKKVIDAAQEGKRENSKLIFGRYEIYKGDRVILVEDIVNNFSTTEQLITLVEKAGGKVVAIVCLINRSDRVVYERESGQVAIPVLSLQHKPTPQYRQDDPAVRQCVEQGRVIFKPKDQWEKLVAAETKYA